MTDPQPKSKKRRRSATVPGVVVTAATLGTTGLAFAYSVKTAPPTTTGKTAQAAAVAAEIAREKAGITQLHSSIASTQSQLKALQTGKPSASTFAAPTPGSPTSMGTSASGTASVANTSTQSASSRTTASGAAAPAAASGGAAAATPSPAAPSAPAPGSSPAPAPTPTPTTTPTTQPAPPPPPPPPPVTTTTGASRTA